VFSGVFIAQEFDGVGEKGSGDTTIDVQTCLDTFLNMSLRFACFTDEVFSDKKQNFQSWNYYPQVLDYQKFLIIGCWIKGILLYYVKFFVVPCFK
jgi:hypothetical protein